MIKLFSFICVSFNLLISSVSFADSVTLKDKIDVVKNGIVIRFLPFPKKVVATEEKPIQLLMDLSSNLYQVKLFQTEYDRSESNWDVTLTGETKPTVDRFHGIDRYRVKLHLTTLQLKHLIFKTSNVISGTENSIHSDLVDLLEHRLGDVKILNASMFYKPRPGRKEPYSKFVVSFIDTKGEMIVVKENGDKVKIYHGAQYEYYLY